MEGKRGRGGSGVCLRRDFCLNCLEERGGEMRRVDIGGGARMGLEMVFRMI